MPPLPVRIKRMIYDQDDAKSFLSWIGKACDLGDGAACDIERLVRSKKDLDTTLDSEVLAARSDSSSSALLALHALWQPEEHPKFLDARTKCLTTGLGCSGAVTMLLRRDKQPVSKELSPELISKLQDICDKTLDCDIVLMMLDKNGYSPDALAPIRAHTNGTLVQACIEGACVCGDAAASLPIDDPRVPPLARLGCENGEASGCYLLGKLHEEGRGVEKDEVFARSLYEAACPSVRSNSSYRTADYSTRACERLAEIHEGGSMPPKNKDQAIYYAEFACLNPGSERDHAPCVKLARYWANRVLTSECSSYNASYCISTTDHAANTFYGPSYPPADAKECERPSVKALCDAHEAEIVALKKPKGKKK